MADTVGPVIDELEGTPRVVMMNGGPTDNNSKLFGQATTRAASSPSRRRSRRATGSSRPTRTPDWDNQQALTLFEQILVAEDNADVDAVFAANDGIAGSVISALESAGVGPIPVPGQDATASASRTSLPADE